MASIVVCRYLFQSALQSVIEGHQIYELTAQQVKDGAVKVNKYYSSVECKLEIAVFLGEPDLGWHGTIPMLEIPTPQPVSERVDRQGIVHDVGCTCLHKGACGVAGGGQAVLQCRLHMQGTPGGKGAGGKKWDGTAQETCTHKAKHQHSPNPHTAKATAPAATTQQLIEQLVHGHPSVSTALFNHG